MPTKQKQNNISRLVLFDIDQTLISNGGAGRKALYRALQEVLSVDLTSLKNANIHMSGKTDPQIVREFIEVGTTKQNNQSETYYQSVIGQTLDLYLQFLPEEIDNVAKTSDYFMHAGVTEILESLTKNEKVALGLLTGNIEKGARIKLERFNLNRFFSIGAYGCDSANRLDLPSVAHKRAEAHYQINIAPAQMIIIGDAENDVLCAKHYGAVSLAVNTGSTTWSQLLALEPDYLFPSLSQTSEILHAIMTEPVTIK